MKERVLSLSLAEAIDAFEGLKWKFFEAGSEEKGVVKVEVPRGAGEAFVVEVPYSSDPHRRAIVAELTATDFIEQRIRVTSDW